MSTAVLRDEVHERVLAFVRRRVPSPEDAEDITQDVMLRIHRNSAELEHAERMTAWVYRIAANAIADHYRRPARRELPSDQTSEMFERAAQAPDDGASDDLRRELAACLVPLMDRLPPLYREALVLTEFDGMTQHDAAARLGISVSGMKARVQRGRAQLGTLLLACCSVDLDRRRAVTAVRPRGAPCGCGSQRDE